MSFLNSIFNRNKSQNQAKKILEIHLTDHCNLKCKACCHFSNIAPDFFIDVESFKNDLIEINKKFDYKFLSLLGGEPLLHPEINTLLKIAVQYKKKQKKVRLSTNGILLKKMNDEFWEIIRENNIIIKLTKYPALNQQFASYLTLIAQHNCNFTIQVNNTFNIRKKNKVGEYDVSFYKGCDLKEIVILKQGKLYKCPICAFGEYYNKYFNKNVYIENGLDIYTNSPEKILDYVNTPSINCNWCTSAQIIPWELSEFKDDEWDVK